MERDTPTVRSLRKLGNIEYTFTIDSKNTVFITAVDRDSKRTWTGLFETVSAKRKNDTNTLSGELLFLGLTEPDKNGVVVHFPSSIPLEGDFIIHLVIPGGLFGEHIAELPLTEKDVSDFERLELQVKDLREELETLRKNSPIVGVTVHTGDNQKSFVNASEHIMLEFDVLKTVPNSILVIQGTLALHGEYNGESTYEWNYGGTVVLAQAEGYLNNSGLSRAIPTSAIIAGHTKTGVQKLTLAWRMKNGQSGRPCGHINPDGSQHVQLRPCKTVIVVMEIL